MKNKYTQIIFIFLAFISLPVFSQSIHQDPSRSLLLGPWQCRSAATENKWVNGGFYPRVNDLFGPLQWTDSAIKANSSLGEMDWNYQTRFHLPAKKYLHYRLHFGQSAIYNQIRVNNRAINCNRYLPAGIAHFCGFTPDLVPALLKDSNNVLRLNYFSPFDPERRVQYTSENSCRIKDNDTSGYIAVLRVPPLQGGWDIAPRRITAGLDEGIYLEGWNHFHVDHFSVQTESANKDSAIINFKIIIETDTIIKVNLQLYAEDLYYTEIFGYRLEYGINELSFQRKIKKAKLWWPNGAYQQKRQKKPALYNAFLTVSQPGDTVKLARKFGIRTIKLVQQKDSFGESFYFLVNNKPIFIKGLNLVPTRGFMNKSTHDSLWRSSIMMQKIANANVNMVRLWGGGGYEEDWFYEACDSLGIMVWQDFMYSGMMYTRRYDQIAEAEYHVRRLSGHPSLALWCGNNEIEVAWKNWGWQNKYNIHGKDSTFLWNEYQQLFHKNLPAIVKKYDSEISYLSSSPISNWGNPADFKSGDNHYWGLWHGEQPMRSLKTNIPRFVSEWGLPSYPLSNFKGAGIIDPDSATMAELDRRLLSYKGAKLLHAYIDSFYNENKNLDYYTQYAGALQLQSLTAYTGINSHRSNRPYCMGTIWWQFNDIWPGTTWSLVDFTGQNKPAYYNLKIAYENLCIFKDIDNYYFKLNYANDGWGDSTLDIGIYSVRNLKNKLKSTTFIAKKESAGPLFSMANYDLNNLLQDEKDVLIIQVRCNGRPVGTFRYKRIYL